MAKNPLIPTRPKGRGKFKSHRGSRGILDDHAVRKVLHTREITGFPKLNAFTPGSIIYVDSNGLMAEDNANFYYDDTNKQIRLGVSEGKGRLVIGATANFDVIDETSASIYFGDDNNTTLEADGTMTLKTKGSNALAFDTSQNTDIYGNLTFKGTNPFIIYGGDTTGDDLHLFANNTDSFPYLKLLGNAEVEIDFGATASMSLLSNTNSVAAFHGDNIYMYQPVTISAAATDTRMLDIDQSTTNYTGTTDPNLIRVRQVISTASSDENQGGTLVDLKYENQHAMTGTPVILGTHNNKGITLDFDVSGAVSADPAVPSFSENNYGFELNIKRSGAYTGNDMTINNFGIYCIAINDMTANTAGSQTENNYAAYFYANQTGLVTAGTITRNNYGIYIDAIGDTNGTSTNYGIYIGQVQSADTNMSFYSSNTADSAFIGNLGIGTSSPASNYARYINISSATDVALALTEGANHWEIAHAGTEFLLDYNGVNKFKVTSAGDTHVGGTGGIKVPVGTTAQRVATQGMIRYNTDTSKFEGYTGAAWVNFH